VIPSRAELLAHLASAKSEEERQQALETLAERCSGGMRGGIQVDAACSQALRGEALEPKAPEKRVTTALWGLGMSGTTEDRRAMLTLVGRSSEIDQGVLRALSGDPALQSERQKLMLSQLQKKGLPARERQSLISGLARGPASEEVTVVLRAGLSDADPEVRRECLDDLARQSDYPLALLPNILQASHDKDSKVRDEARSLLKARYLENLGQDPEARGSAIARHLKEHPEWATPEAVLALAQREEHQGRLAPAGELFARALALDRQEPSAGWAKIPSTEFAIRAAVNLAEQGRRAEALKLVDRLPDKEECCLIKLERQTEDSCRSRSTCALAKKQLHEALKVAPAAPSKGKGR
jgi:hypothetical protein